MILGNFGLAFYCKSGKLLTQTQNCYDSGAPRARGTTKHAVAKKAPNIFEISAILWAGGIPSP